METDFMTPIGEMRLPDGSRLLFCYGVRDFSLLPELPARERIALAVVEIFHLHKSNHAKANFTQISDHDSSLHCSGCGMTQKSLRGDVRTLGDLAAALKSKLELPRGQQPVLTPESL